MRNMLVSVLVLLLCMPLTLADRGINMDGTMSWSVSMEVANEYDFSIGVMWQNENGGEVKVVSSCEALLLVEL